MTALNYRLIVVTHGDAPNLERVLASFEALVTPTPRERVLVVDGPGRVPIGMDDWEIWGASRQAGFCATYERVWRAARSTKLPFVFLLENDFLFLRPVELAPIAGLLHTIDLAQVALVRQAVNEQEKAAGGLIESRPGQFTAREHEGHPYLEHTAFFTSNPCLFRSSLARVQPWPDVPEFCEGHYGIQLRDEGYRFAFWGDGSPWVEHVGVRDGSGHGY